MKRCLKYIQVIEEGEKRMDAQLIQKGSASFEEGIICLALIKRGTKG